MPSSTAAFAPPPPPDVPVYLLSSRQYWEMVRAGILTEEDHVELLDGWIVPKMTKKQPHNIASGRTADAILRVLPAGWYVGREEPFVAGNLSTPEPDVMLVRGDRDDYPDDPPGATMIGLVVEVAESSLGRDRGRKARIYAESSIPFYWLLNLPARRLVVHSEPTGPGEAPAYRTRVELGEDEAVPLNLDGVEVARFVVRDLLPRPAGR